MAGGEREDKKQDSQHAKNWWKKIFETLLNIVQQEKHQKELSKEMVGPWI